MHLGTLLSISTVVLLTTEVVAVLGLFRLTRQVDGKPGGHLLRIVTRTMALVVAAQIFEVWSDIALDVQVEDSTTVPIIVVELASVVLIFLAILWAWYDLTRHDYRR